MERSQPVSKAFTRLRRKLARTATHLLTNGRRGRGRAGRGGLAHVPQNIRHAGKRRARGGTRFSQWTLAKVMGHSKSYVPLAMTMGVYVDNDPLVAN